MKNHLKRLAMPRSWSLPRKSHKWVTKPSPGPHPQEWSMPLSLILRDMLGHCDTGREARRIIGSRLVHVDGKPVTNPKHPVGIMDVISIPSTKEHYRFLLDPRGHFTIMKLAAKDAKWKIVRIENKTTVKGGSFQLNLHDGRNILLEKNDYKSGDSLKISLPEQKILGHYSLAKGNSAMLIAGKHAGELVHIENYTPTRNPKENIVTFEEGFATVKDNVFVIGKKKPEIELPTAPAI
ncbi:MAG: 30S ribosomal protein S4e [Methanobacteriota archaeon]|nr:MAG: 30S ribosomal protein S4e [Euryarchaeota archaeon]